MAELELKWFHSNGWDNKDPLYDLGGSPSRFEIAAQSMNNLFDDVQPDDAVIGLVDYRCIYVVNKTLNTTYSNITVDLDSDDACSAIAIGSKIQNDQQRIELLGDPDDDGYVIFDNEFGGYFTCYWTGDFASFASEIETKIRMIPMCSTVTVADEGAGSYLVTYNGDARNRKVDLLRMVQNSLTSQQGNEYRVSSALSTDSFNHQGDYELNVTNFIAGVPSSGLVHVFNYYTGLYDHMSYSSYAGTTFTLTTPLSVDLVTGISNLPSVEPTGQAYEIVWVDQEDNPSCPVKISKVQDGGPINQIAALISNTTTEPDWSVSVSAMDVGTLKPLDGFFIWIRRTTTAGKPGCTGDFDLILTGDY